MNADILFSKGDELTMSVLYEGDGYKIYGPLSELFVGGGILVAESQELIDDLRANRKEFAQILNDAGISIIDTMATPKDAKPPQMVVNLPPAGYVNLATLMGRRIIERERVSEDGVEASPTDIVLSPEQIFEREKGRGVYTDDLSASDFWIDPSMNNLFFVALDKLKKQEGDERGE